MKKLPFISALSALSFLAPLRAADACTHITLTGADGTVVSARTMEWEIFDLKTRLNVVPRNTEFKSFPMPDNKPGMTWKGKYGFVGTDLLNLTAGDLMNEKGLTVLMHYFPKSAEYQPYDASQALNSLTAGNLSEWIGSKFATVAEVREALATIRVVTFSHPDVGGQVDMHWAIADPSGDQIVVEYTGGELHIYDAKLGVMTNSPSFDWHLTNLRNYINMRPVEWPAIKVADKELKPIGYGTGLLGIPGDLTPPSRFIRAVAFSQTARKTTGSFDTVRETFRILDNFNLPVSPGEPEKGMESPPLSGTQYTSAYDMKNLVLYYHTDNNRMIRKVDLKAIDFGSLKKPITSSLRGDGTGVVDVTPK